jgi:TonB-dependent SusC/RagA subfamily outer membrane receptor
MQQIQLNIPEPCHEDWQNMTPTEQGRFCNACAKQVVDFSMMTDTQVLNYFLNKKEEKVCGRADPDQLDRIISKPKEPKKRLFWYWNYITMLFLFFSKTNTAKAQGGVKVDTVSRFNTNAFQPTLLQCGVKGISLNWYSVIKGIVRDEDGLSVPFAAVIIKGEKMGISADDKGAYSIKVNISKQALQVSAVGFDTKEIKLNGLNSYDVTLTRSAKFLKGEVVIVGGISADNDYSTPADPKHVAILEVKDNDTMQPVKASVIIERKGYHDIDSASTDKKGLYKIKKIREYETYTVKIKADGYVDKELQINGSEFSKRKQIKEVLLDKDQTRQIVMGRASSMVSNKGLLYLLDGKRVSADDINTDNVEDVSVLLAPAATALFGPDGANGAIVITTKKPEYKKMDTVVVKSYSQGLIKRVNVMGQMRSVTGHMISGTSVKRTFTDSIKSVITKITGDLKVYPNPVQKGNVCNLSFKLKQTGAYNMRIVNAAGLIVLQKQSTATTKQYVEQVHTGSEWSSGMYYISLFDSNNKLISTTNFLIQ